MGTVQVRSLDQPDKTRSLPNGVVEMVTIADTMIGRARFQPGWRWSNDVKPIAGTEWCMFRHEGYCVSGSAIIRGEDGSETRIGPDDGYVIQPGYDAWVVGDEPWVTVDSPSRWPTTPSRAEPATSRSMRGSWCSYR
jgi:hypothetical protein